MTAFTLECEFKNRIDLLAPACVLDIDLEKPLKTVTDLHGFVTAYVVFYSGQKPLGVSILPIHGDRCLVSDIEKASVNFEVQQAKAQLEFSFSRAKINIPTQNHDVPKITVVVPTCNRLAHLKICLEGLHWQTHAAEKIIVVDNCEEGNKVQDLLKKQFPDVIYTKCDVPGSSAARNAGAALSDTDYLAFIDDDARPAATWLENLVYEIDSDPRIAIVSGLILPAEIRTESQAKMEALGGFSGGFNRRYVLPVIKAGEPPEYLDFPKLGVGCQLLVRRAVFQALGGFDESIGAGLGIDGEDVDFYSRAINEGHAYLYEPSAVVYHYHLREEADLERQLLRASWSTAYLWGRMVRNQPRLKQYARKRFVQYARQLSVQAIQATLRPDILNGKIRRKKLIRFVQGYMAGHKVSNSKEVGLWRDENAVSTFRPRSSVSVRQIDFFRQLPLFIDSGGLESIEIQVFCGEKYIISLRLPAVRSCVSSRQIISALPDNIIESLLGNVIEHKKIACAENPIALTEESEIPTLYLDRQFYWRPVVSVVIPTRDRPDDLLDCLWRISCQDYDGDLEVIVVDNNPSSGLTRPIVESFPQFVYMICNKLGAAATRNTGFKRARGEIIAITDDDVLVPQGWIRNIVKNFWRQDIWMVNGSVLAYELISVAELDFEDKIGFPLHHTAIEASGSIIRDKNVVSLFTLGVSANMAFRRNVIENPAIGMMAEVLGPGTHSGAGEDPEFIYRVLKEGHTVLFEPSIWVYHRHRRNQKDLNKQIYNYGKSAVAIYLHMLIEHRDFLSIPMLIFYIPKSLIKQFFYHGRRFWLLELQGIHGYFSGFPAYFWSRSKDKRYERKNARDK